MFKKKSSNNETVEKFDDGIQKFTLVFCTERESSEKWDRYELANEKIIYEFTQCLLRNFKPKILEFV